MPSHGPFSIFWKFFYFPSDEGQIDTGGGHSVLFQILGQNVSKEGFGPKNSTFVLFLCFSVYPLSTERLPWHQRKVHP